MHRTTVRTVCAVLSSPHVALDRSYSTNGYELNQLNYAMQKSDNWVAVAVQRVGLVCVT